MCVAMSCEKTNRLLKLVSKSKDDFLKAFRQLGQSDGRQVYIQILSEMEKTMASGDVSNFKVMNEAIEWINNSTPAETLESYCGSLRDTNFLILACKHNNLEIVKYLFGNTDQISQSTSPWKLDDEGHGAIYYAIRSGNVELLGMLVDQWPGGYFTHHPEEMERALSAAYDELKLKNVALSDEMELFVENKLLNLRFFSKVEKGKTSPSCIVERIMLVIEKIRMLRAESSLAGVDNKFIYITTFVAQNIHILKQQLNSTYNMLPWEEMEFSLVCFICAHTKHQELNIFFRSVLNKANILEYLDHFSNLLENLTESIQTSSIYSLGKPVRLNRDEVIADILNRNDKFRGLYSGYKEMRDVYSLQIMKRYIDAALLADCGTREGQLTVKRALQVMGEHLKNSVESPKLSEEVSELLLLSVPGETRKILTNLRNSLSKTHFILVKDAKDECELFSNVQNDINKVGVVITDLLIFKKIRKIKSFLTKIIESSSLDEVNEILEAFQDVDLPKSNYENQMPREIQHEIVDIIHEIDSTILEKTNYEKELFKQINEVLPKAKNNSKDLSYDYVFGLTFLKSASLSSACNKGERSWTDNNKANALGGKRFLANKLLAKYSTVSSRSKKFNFRLLSTLLLNLRDSVESRVCPEISDKIYFSISLIKYINTCENDNLMWIDDFNERLSKYKPNKNRSNVTNNNIKNAPEDPLVNQLKRKLSDLGDIISAFSLDDNLNKKLSAHKDNNKTKFVIEMLILDILSVLDSSNCLANNALFLDDDAPLLSGKCLRNHLAHVTAMFDLLYPDIFITLLSNAKSLTENTIENNRKIGNIVIHDIDKLQQKYTRGLQILSRQEEMTAALKEGNLTELKRCLKEGADTYSRDINLWTSFHMAVQGSNIEVIKFLFKRNVRTTERNIAGQVPLHVAATYGRANIVEFLVNEVGSPINEIDEFHKTPLHLAAQNGHRETVEKLLFLRASHTIKDNEGYSPVHCAVENNHLDVAEVLLGNEVNVDVNEAIGGFTCLHVAADYSHVKLVQYLLQNNADVNAKSSVGERPLHLAALGGCVEIVKALIDKGAKVNLRTLNSDCPPLNYAVKYSHEDVVQTLLEHGACVNIGDNRYNTTPLHWAASNGHKTIVELLLKYKANVNAVDCDDTTPLLCAAATGHLEVVELLIQNGSRKDSTDKNGRTALHLSIMHSHNDIVKSFIENGFNIHIGDKHKQTPLHLAVKFGNQVAVNILLAAGADVKSASDDGSTPLHFSARIGNEAITDALIKMGAPLDDVDMDNFTPLHVAVSIPGNEKIIKLLIKHGADVNVNGKENSTPLHVASLMGHTKAVDVLIENSAFVDATTHSGDTPLHLAAEGNHKAVVEILIEHGAKEISGALCRAVKNNYGDLANILIAKGADVNTEHGKPLIFAISAGYRGIVEALLKNKNINIDVKDLNGAALLHLAALSGNWNIGRALIKRGVEINPEASEKITPLSVAVLRGHKEFVDVLLAHGADVNALLPENTSLLHIAVSQSHRDIVESLLSSGANHNIKDENNRTALEFAVSNAQLDIVQIFFEHCDINVNEKGYNNWTILHIAAQSGNLDCIKFLVNKGADIDTKDKSGLKPIHTAAREGFIKIVEFFLECGMSINDEGAAGHALLHYAAMGGQAKVAQYLIGKDANINAASQDGEQPIHLAAREGHLEVLNVLVQSGAIYDNKDRFGNKPVQLAKNINISKMLESIENLFKAVKRNDISRIESLIIDGASVNARSAVKPALLHLICWKGYGQACDILLKNKAYPNITGQGGITPLHYAAKFSHLKIVQSLLKNCAKYNATTDNGKTPLDFATEDNIIYLLKLVDRSFSKVKRRDIQIINDLKKILDFDIIKAVMKAHNIEGKSLVVVAIENNFPKVDVLKQVLQENITLKLATVEEMIAKENFIEALRNLKFILDERREILGEENPGTLDVQERIATIWCEQSRYSEASELLEKVYQKRVEILGPNNEDSLRSRSVIAFLLHRQGRHSEALEMFQDIYKKQKEMLGDNHLEVFKTRLHTGLTLAALQKYEEALNINYENYEKCLKIFGAEDNFTLSVRNNIAMVLENLGRHNEALNIYQMVFETRKRLLGQNHSNTLRAMHNMARVLMNEKKSNEAMKIFREVLAVQKNTLGVNHCDTIYTQINIGNLCLSENKLTDAVQVFKAVGADQRKKVLGAKENLFINEIIQRYDESEKFAELDVAGHYIYQIDVINAARRGDVAVLENLIKNGSNVDTADAADRTPLHFAVDEGHAGVVRVLLKTGADATAVTTKGNTALHTAASRDCVEIAELLLQNVRETKQSKFNDFINAKTVVGGTSALHVACKKGSMQMVKCLLKYGACYNLADRALGSTPLQYSQSPDVICLLQLIQELFMCAENGDTRIVMKLQAMETDNLKATLNARDEHLQTPLQVALVNKHKIMAISLSGILKDNRLI